MREPDDPALEEVFQRPKPDNYQITSAPVSIYNCLAWAVGSTHAWWDTVRISGYYWPPGVPRDDSLESWIEIFRLHGFRSCNNGEFEPGWEKIAIYVDDAGEPQHAARQLPDGTWTSKLGEWEDIRHQSLESLECGGYGKATEFLRKRRPV